MNRIPIVDARTMERVLFRLGFVAERQRGSHVFNRHPDGRTTTFLIMRGGILRVP